MYLYQQIRTVVKEKTKRIPHSIIQRTNAFPIVIIKARSSKIETKNIYKNEIPIFVLELFVYRYILN